MPSKEIKNTFEKGIQVRDLDKRLVGKGYTREVMNGRIARSEGGDVGALENVRGNVALSDFVDDSAVIIGSIRQQSEDRIFYFVVGSREDGIYEFRENVAPGERQVRIILRSTARSGVLKFSVDNLITGINILGEDEETLLFWTDGVNPPRRINVERMVERHQGLLDGIVKDVETGEVTLTGFTEEEISVVKRPPSRPPTLDIIEIDDLNPDNDDELEVIREENLKEKFVRFATRYKFIDDEYSTYSPFSEVPFSAGKFRYDATTGSILSMENLVRKINIGFNTGPRDVVEVDLLYKADDSEIVYVVESYEKNDPDLNWRDNIILSTLNNEEGRNEQPVEFSSNKIYRPLTVEESNATFHNVPLTAQSQEVIQNRIVYGNYSDRYNIDDLLSTYHTDAGELVKDGEVFEPITLDLDVELFNNSLNKSAVDPNPDFIGEFGEKNLKSDRDYEVGIVYFDSVGRSTPVLTSANNSIHVPVQRANRRNRIQVTINHKAPHWATHYRFFVKNSRDPHYSIIPIDSFIDPSNNEFVWFQISQFDSGKIKDGDYVILKLHDSLFSYENGRDIIKIRIEEVGPQERNFLEPQPPTADGEADSAEIELQAAGIWMKVKNRIEINRDENSAQSDNGTTSARSNNPSGAGGGHRPIMGTTTSYQDETYYYRSPISAPGEVVNEESVVFSGIYDAGDGLVDSTNPNGFLTNLQFGPTDGGHGPMRVEVIIEEANKYTVAFFLSPGIDSALDGKPVIRQILNIGGTDLPAAGTTVALMNGISVTFPLDPDAYSAGDKWTCVWRVSTNFLWRAWEVSGGAPANRYREPNSTDKWAFNARVAKILVTGPMDPDTLHNGVSGGAKLQIGVTDGRNNAQNGTPISLNFDTIYTSDRNVYYPTLEEWFFEEGLYGDDNDGTVFNGTDGEGGTFGIHKCGFWRGTTRKASGLSGGKGRTDKGIYRLISDTSGPLHWFIESGTYNDGSDPNDAGLNMTSEISFIQGTGADRDDAIVTNPTTVFETIPDESPLEDILFYEVGQTYKCENGIHYGDDPNNHQRLEVTLPDTEGTEVSVVSKPVQITMDYTNCITFSNGFESSTINDEIGKPTIAEGAKASIVVDNFEREDNTASIIFSGAFNANTGVNNTNVFSSAEVATRSIIKQLDTNYGSIQKLYGENRNLYVFQEDKVSAVQVDRNTLFNADGSSNVSSSNLFLNETLPISGEYGISRNPESFAVYGTEKFWSDKNRGVILSLTGQTITEISENGMRDFFRDNLANNELVIGNYDDYHDQYIITMRDKFTDPVFEIQNIPLLLSRQGFTSRNDACRYPENKLQFSEVYEFYANTEEVLEEPLGFQVGDIIYSDLNRTSPFNGDNDYFVWFDSRGDIPVTTAADTTSQGIVKLTFDTANPLFDAASRGIESELIRGQAIEVQSLVNTSTIYQAEITDVDPDGVHIRYASGTTFETGDDLEGASLDFAVTIKYVVAIDSFGVVRRKLNCLGIQPLNHDAFRASLQGYQSPQEACGNGIIGRLLYHNGDDATPDGGDYIYDSPYAGDEYVEQYQNYLIDFPYDTFDRIVFDEKTYEAIQDVPAGITPVNTAYWKLTDIPAQYTKGRTQREGWFKIFDGVDFEDYVIFIIQGTVVPGSKTRCASIALNRKRILIGDHVLPYDPTGTMSRDEYSALVCRQLPTEERFHDGNNDQPAIGDRVYENDFEDTTLGAGSYSLEGGYYMEVNSNGVVINIIQCIVRTCIFDLINTYGVNVGVVQARQVGTDVDGNEVITYPNNQISSTGTFRFVGVIDEEIYGTTERQLAAAATIRWVARGSERYPSNPNDFYEQTFYEGTGADGSLAAGTEFTLTNPSFVVDSAGETDLEYTILEICYDRNLVPQNIIPRYYAPDNTVLPDNSYPSDDPATALARIFDLTGNIGTGTVAVTEEIFYDRTLTTNRIYYTDEDLTVLDGTNGGGDPKWWAFGDVDNDPATEACLIDANGEALDCRSRDFPYEFTLSYSSLLREEGDISQTGELASCIGTADVVVYTDTGDTNPLFKDFETVTDMRLPSGAVPPSGYYTHTELEGTASTDDDDNLVRYWRVNEDGTGGVFENRWINPTDQVTPESFNLCPHPITGVNIRYSEVRQTAVCSSGTFVDAYISDFTATFADKTNVIVWRNQYGFDAFPAAWFGPDENGATWYWNGVDTISQEHEGCELVCDDACADNNGLNGDCSYPTYCNDPAANNYQGDDPCASIWSPTGTCTYDQGTWTYALDAPSNVEYTNPASQTGNNVDSYSFTDPTVTPLAGFIFTTTPVFSGDSLTGTIGNGGTVNRTLTVTVEAEVEGCTNSSASNYNPNANVDDGSCEFNVFGCTTEGADNHDSAANVDNGTCYWSVDHVTGGNGQGACDNANSDQTATTFYTNAADGTELYTDTALTAAFTGWISDGTDYYQYTDGVRGEALTCLPPIRIGKVTVERLDQSETDIIVGVEFSVTVSAINIVGVNSVTVAAEIVSSISPSIIGETVQPVSSVVTADGATAHTFEFTLSNPEYVGTDFSVRGTVSSGDVSRSGLSDQFSISDAL